MLIAGFPIFAWNQSLSAKANRKVRTADSLDGPSGADQEEASEDDSSS